MAKHWFEEIVLRVAIECRNVPSFGRNCTVL